MPADPPDLHTPAGHRERLTVPLRWWVQGTMLVATLWLALVVAVPALVAWGATVIALALLVALLGGYGAAPVRVESGVLLAGRARVSVEHLGRAEALDQVQTRRAAGVDADARAFLLLRPYLRRAVRVEITDPRDPAPYWLLSTRRPEALVAALAAAESPSG